MSRWRARLARWLGAARRTRADRELDDEIRSHFEEAIDELVRQGLAPAEARRQAHHRFGSIVAAREAHRDARSLVWLDHLRREARDATRAIVRRPASSAVIVAVLALGLGSVSAVFSLVHAVLLRPLPFPEPDRLVTIGHSAPGVGLAETGASSGLLFHYQDHAASLEAIGPYSGPQLLNLSVEGRGTERVNVARASWRFFQTLGVRPVAGRLFTEEDGRPGFRNLNWTVPVLLAHAFWVGHFGADPDIPGRLLTINDNMRRVVGVLPPDLPLPNADADIWMLSEPLRETANLARSFREQVIARLRPGETAASAERDLTMLLSGIEGAYRDATPARIAELRLSPVVRPLKSALVADVAPVLWPLFGGMLLLLAMAGVSAGGLFVVRVEHRRQEIAVRAALGASGAQLARLLLIEAAMLASAATTAGLFAAHVLLDAVVAWLPADLPRASAATVNGWTVGFATAASLVIGAAFAGVATRRQRGASLTGLGNRATERRRALAGTNPVVLLQAAIAVMLMIGSALMVQTYRNLSRVELGFEPDQVIVTSVSLPWRQAGRHARIYQALVDRVGRIPGVTASGAITTVPLGGVEYEYPIESGAAPVLFKFFVPGYFEAMETRVVEGAAFESAETPVQPYPVFVGATLARRLGPDGTTVGLTIRRLERDGTMVELGHGPVPPFTVAGVVEDVREVSLRGAPPDVVYIPILEPNVEQSIVPTTLTLVVRSASPVRDLAPLIRQAVADVDPAVGVGQPRAMASFVSTASRREAFVGLLLVLAAAMAMCLGAAGIYASVADQVRRRTQEIGIRLALGARRREVAGLVCGGSLRSALAGAALGLVAAAVGARALASLLFGITPGDPLTQAGIAGLLLVVSLGAALLAAWQAVRLSPLSALRRE